MEGKQILINEYLVASVQGKKLSSSVADATKDSTDVRNISPTTADVNASRNLEPIRKVAMQMIASTNFRLVSLQALIE